MSKNTTIIPAMNGRLPMSALLSAALVAFTIESDNEAEHQMPHRTTRNGVQGEGLHKPWLVSTVMWSNCLRYVPDEGITARELERLARTATNLAGMQRWGYITVGPGKDKLIRLRPGGRMAREIYRTVFGDIEMRWKERFGERTIDALREGLGALAQGVGAELPDCLPILGYGLYSNRICAGVANEPAARPNVAALLSKVLLAFALEFERESEVSLAISANVLRVLGREPLPMRELPRLSGVSKEAIAMAVGFLHERGYVEQAKLVTLTEKGLAAKSKYESLAWRIENDWRERFGDEAISGLRESLEELAGNATAASHLFSGLKPYPDNWRASVRKPETLPHYPMVLHRGGYPDGS